MSLGKGEETLPILHSCARKVAFQFCWECCARQGMLWSGWCVSASKVGIRLQSCLKESSCISAVCFSFSKLYAYRDVANPEQSSSPDLPTLHFAVPSRVSRRLAMRHNLCCWQFTRVHGCTLPLVQMGTTSFVHVFPALGVYLQLWLCPAVTASKWCWCTESGSTTQGEL